MRAVVAKRLRKQAREATVGLPERQLLGMNTVKKVKVTNIRHPKYGETIDVKMQSVVNDPNSFRGMYRLMKRAYGLAQ